MLFQGKDGELRLFEPGNHSGTSAAYYFEILFTEMDFTGPVSRARTEETLIMDRGNFDTNAHYIQGNSEPRYAPLDITFSMKIEDTIDTRQLYDWLSGVSTITNTIGGTSTIGDFKGGTTIDGNTLPTFAGNATKMAKRVEILFDGSSDYGIQYNEVYFPHEEITITEAADGITLSATGKAWGDVTRITSFWSGSTVAFV